MQDPEVAVLGANGFIGRRLATCLKRRGISLAEFTRSVPFSLPDGRPVHDLGPVRTAYWLISSTNPQTAETHPERVAADISAMTAFMDTLERGHLSPRIVLVSSGGTVYDPAFPPPYAEDAPVRPVSAYAALKLRLEQLVHSSTRAEGGSVVLRVSNAYGPGQPAIGGQGVIAYWLHALRERRPMVIYGDPATTRDYVYVDDVIDALVRVHQHADPLPPFLNVGSGTATSLQELAEMVLQVTGAHPDSLLHREARTVDLARTWLDVTAARDLLGWEPRTGLREGLTATWQALNVSTDVAE